MGSGGVGLRASPQAMYREMYVQFSLPCGFPSWNSWANPNSYLKRAEYVSSGFCQHGVRVISIQAFKFDIGGEIPQNVGLMFHPSIFYSRLQPHPAPLLL